MKHLRFFLPVLALIVTSFAFAQDAAQVETYLRRSTSTRMYDMVMGDPVNMLRSWMLYINQSQFRQAMLTFAGVLAFAGFLVSIWKATINSNTAAMKGAFANVVVTGMMLSVCFNFGNYNQEADKQPFTFSYFAFNQWSGGYAWSRNTFADGLEDKIEEAETALYQMLSQVVSSAGILAVPSALRVGGATVKATALGVRGAGATKGVISGTTVAGKGAAKVGASIGGQLLGKLKLTMSFLQYLMLGMAFVVFITGFSIMICIYLMPIAIAIINWGNTSWLWRFIGTIVGCWFTVMFVPLATVIAIDQAFVRPAQAMQFYSEELAIKREEVKTASEAATDGVIDEGTTQADECLTAADADPAAVDSAECQELLAGTWFEKGMDKLVGFFTQNLGWFSDIVNDVINILNRMLVMVAFSSIGLLIGLSLLIGLPAFFIGLFSGVASSLNNSNLNTGKN